MDKILLQKVIGERQIYNLIKAKKLGGLFFIYGNENYLKLFYANEIAKTAVSEDFIDFNLHKLDGSTVSIETIKDAAAAVPMFSEGTCVLIHDLPINGMKKNDFENLISILNSIPSTCSFIMLMDTVEKKKSKTEREDENQSGSSGSNEGVSEKKIDAWDEVLEIALIKGLAIELNKRASSLLTSQLIKKAEEKGSKLDTRTAEYLIESVGNDIANLQSELDKICSFVKGKSISNIDIDAIAAKTVETRIYDMVNNLIDKKIDSAFFILDTLFAQKVEPIIIVGTLISPFADMYRVKAAIQAGYQPEDAAKYFDYKKKEFRLKNLAKSIKNLSTDMIGMCLDFLDDADTVLKTRALDPKIVVEQTMARIYSTLNNDIA